MLTCDFVTLAAGDVCLHALDFVGRHPGRVVDGEGPEQPVFDGLVNLSRCHAEDPAGLGNGIGTKARHAGSFLCWNEAYTATGARHLRPRRRVQQQLFADDHVKQG
jgi:hypothetical protein